MNFKTGVLAVAIPLIILDFACKKPVSQPDEIAIQFLEAIQHSDYDRAKELSTSESAPILDALASFQEMLPESLRNQFKSGHFSIDGVNAEDTLTLISYHSDVDTLSKRLKLLKRKGEWKVAFDIKAVFSSEEDTP